MYKCKTKRRFVHFMVATVLWTALPAQAQGRLSQPSTVQDEHQPDIYFETDPKSWARVKRLVLPKYPPEQLAKGIGDIVEIEVLIDVTGEVKKIRSIKSDSGNVAFEQAIRDVLMDWLFSVPLTARCVPYETVGSAQMMFEMGGEKGKITLSHRAWPMPPKVNFQQAPKVLNRNDVAAAARRSFPDIARRVNVEAHVYALLTIDHVTGAVLEVDVTHVLTADKFDGMFTDAAKRALKWAKYPPQPARTTPWKTCFSIGYRLSGESYW